MTNIGLTFKGQNLAKAKKSLVVIGLNEPLEFFSLCQMPSFNHKYNFNDFVFSAEWQNLIGPLKMTPHQSMATKMKIPPKMKIRPKKKTTPKMKKTQKGKQPQHLRWHQKWRALQEFGAPKNENNLKNKRAHAHLVVNTLIDTNKVSYPSLVGGKSIDDTRWQRVSWEWEGPKRIT